MSQEATIQSRFQEFHETNPSIYSELVALARQLKGFGHEYYSIDALFHVVRWHRAVRVNSRDMFKLNDHYTSRYVRLIERQELDLGGFFRTRNLRTA